MTDFRLSGKPSQAILFGKLSVSSWEKIRTGARSLGTESGLDLQRAVRASPGPRPAVVFITGRRDLFPEMAAQLGPADDWVGKPWDPSELVARVRLAVVRSRR